MTRMDLNSVLCSTVTFKQQLDDDDHSGDMYYTYNTARSQSRGASSPLSARRISRLKLPELSSDNRYICLKWVDLYL